MKTTLHVTNRERRVVIHLETATSSGNLIQATSSVELTGQKSIRLSVVIPTLYEAKNIEAVVERITRSLHGVNHEIIIVDDNSQDGTQEVCARLAASLPVRLIVRAVPTDGLSGAVLLGLSKATGDNLVVMDADLQHPPEKIPELLEKLKLGAEFAMGSRYVKGGEIAGRWSVFRRVNSRVATFLAKPFAGEVRDPMSGFFAMTRDVYERRRFVAPTGYKIALELLCKCGVSRVTEVPIQFGLRVNGQSKLSIKEQVRYIEHLSRLYDFSYPRLSPVLKFVLTVLVSLMVGIFMFWQTHVQPPWLHTVAAYAFGLLVVAAFHARYVNRQREFLVRKSPWFDFFVSCLAELTAVGGVAWYVSTRVSGPTSFDLFLIPFGCGVVVRYVIRKELFMDVRGLRFEPSYAERLAAGVVDRPV